MFYLGPTFFKLSVGNLEALHQPFMTHLATIKGSWMCNQKVIQNQVGNSLRWSSQDSLQPWLSLHMQRTTQTQSRLPKALSSTELMYSSYPYRIHCFWRKQNGLFEGRDRDTLNSLPLSALSAWKFQISILWGVGLYHVRMLYHTWFLKCWVANLSLIKHW